MSKPAIAMRSSCLPRATLAAIHVAKKQLGLDDETYRDLLQRVTGKRSAGELTEAEAGRVLEEMRGKGFERGVRTAPAGAMKLDGPYAAKLRALWITGWNLGVTNDRTDAALVAFVKRQTGIDHVSWLRDGAEASRAIEGLKAWLARAAGVEWSTARAAMPMDSKRAVIAAQQRILGTPDLDMSKVYNLDGAIADLGDQIRRAKS